MKVKKVKELKKFIEETAKSIKNAIPEGFDPPRSIDYDIPVGEYGTLRFTYYRTDDE